MHGVLETSQRAKPLQRHRDSWTLREHEVVVSHWPDISEIRARLPYRSVSAINSFAGKCNLRKRLHVWSEEETALLKKRIREQCTRKQIAHELRLSLTQVQNRCQFLGLHTDRRPPTKTGDKLMDSIRLRAFEMNITLKELDEACRSGRQFRCWSLSRRISMKYISRVMKVLDGELVPLWTKLETD